VFVALCAVPAALSVYSCPAPMNMHAACPSHCPCALCLFTDCAKQGLAVKPAKGDALFFLSIQADGNSMDELSLHTSCPVTVGSKYVATKWLRMDAVHGY